jgi:hypothetical protein
MKASALRYQGMNARRHPTQETPMLKKLTAAGSLAMFIALGSLTPLSAAQNPPAQGVGEPHSHSDTQDTKKTHGKKMQCGKMHGEKMDRMKAGEMNEHMGTKPEQKMGGRGMKK